MKATKTNPYKVSPNYLPCPATSLYTNTDYEISKEDYIQEIISEVEDIQDTIAGDIDLDYIEFKVKYNKISFVPVGCWLWRVRTYKSYKKTHKTFAEWCKDVAHITYSTALRLIKASTVWLDLASMGFNILPTSISQCLVLYDVPPEELYNAWNLVLNNLEPHHITKESINILLNGDTKKISTKVNLPVELFNCLWSISEKASTTISKVIGWMYYELFINNTKVSNVEDWKYERWQEDLQDLVSNHDDNYVS